MPLRRFALCTALLLLVGCSPKQPVDAPKETAIAVQQSPMPHPVEAADGSYRLIGASVIDTALTPNSSYASAHANEIALLVTAGGIVTGNNLAVEKSGDASDVETALLQGSNSAVHVLRGGQINLTDSTILSRAIGGVGLYLTDETTLATLTGGSIETAGVQAPAILVKNAAKANLVGTTVRAASSTALLMQGGSITIDAGNLAGDIRFAGLNTLSVRSSGLEAADTLFTIENGESTVLLTGAALTLQNDRLAFASDGVLHLVGDHQAFMGSLITEGNGEIVLDLKTNSTYTGRFDPDTYSYLSLALDETSHWYVTGDSYLEILIESEHAIGNIESNGFTVYYNSENEQNAWLQSKPYALAGGGYLSPRI